MPRFTIGIPTYNRAGLLLRAIETALDQSWPDVEVIVSDDASTDETPEVAHSFGDRVRYHRNARNIGSWQNFVKVAELAGGEYFSWLQDDDLVHRDFARRATQAMARDDDVAVYAAFEVEGPSATVFYRPLLYGPPIPLDWMRSELRIIDGTVIAPISFFASFVNPPAVAFRTSILRKAIQYVDPECELFNERIVVARAADKAKVAVDPWPAAIFFYHERQRCRLKSLYDTFIQQWLLLADHLGNLLETSEVESWKPLLRQCFDEMAIQDRLSWIRHIAPGFPPLPEEIWGHAHPSAREVRSMLVDTLPASVQQEFFRTADQEKVPQDSWFKQAARQLTPPLAWDALRSIRQRLRHTLHEYNAT